MVVLLHGGFWRARYTKVLMTGLARSVTAHGWAALNVEYRRVGAFGGGGGWPATFEDVAAAVDHLAAVDGVDLKRVVSCGHSAGGHLALWLAARPGLPPGAPGQAVGVAVGGAVALAGVADLRRAADLGLGGGAVEEFLGGGPTAVKDRYQLASPAERLPFGVPQVLIHGTVDEVVPASMSEAYAARAVAAGDDARYVPVTGGHRHMLMPGGAAWAAALPHLARLLG